MMTYLPLANLTDSVRCFHHLDLYDQAVDAGSALRQCAEEEGRPTTVSTPAIVRMWRGYEGGLWSYFLLCCRELQARQVDAVRFLQEGNRIAHRAGYLTKPGLMPRWFGWRPIHDSHASTLIRKRPTHYARLWPTVPLNMPVLWPRNTPGRFDFSVRISSAHREKILAGEMVLPLKEQYLSRVEGWR